MLPLDVIATYLLHHLATELRYRKGFWYHYDDETEYWTLCTPDPRHVFYQYLLETKPPFLSTSATQTISDGLRQLERDESGHLWHSIVHQIKYMLRWDD